jgi:hypothetical protein
VSAVFLPLDAIGNFVYGLWVTPAEVREEAAT